jgi:molecular chaperone GrpE
MEKAANAEKSGEKPAETIVEGASAPETEATSQTDKDAGQDLFKKIQDEMAEAKDKYLRLYAEFENFRRRTAREKLDMEQMSNFSRRCYR